MSLNVVGHAAGLPYVSVGTGPPLALFPGLSRCPLAVDEAGMRAARRAYGPLAAATGRTVYAIGRPPGLARGVSMATLAATHAAAIEVLLGAPADLMGISTGGAVALQLAVDCPQVVRRLVIAAAASWLGADGRDKLRRYGEAVAAGRTGARVLASVLAPRSIEPIAAIGLWLAHLTGERRCEPADMLATIDAECGFDVTARMAEIAAPTLVIGGTADRAFPVDLIRATAAGIKHAELRLYDGRGHVSTMFDPRFGRDVAAFLAR